MVKSFVTGLCIFLELMLNQCPFILSSRDHHGVESRGTPFTPAEFLV